jgi:hypothetical protein
MIVTGCSENPTQPTQLEKLSPTAENSLQQVEVSVTTHWGSADMVARGIRPLRSSLTIRAPISATGRVITVPTVGPQSEIADRMKQAALAYPEFAEQLRSYRGEIQLEISEPARFATVLCTDSRAWSERAVGADRSTIITEGIGDSPALRTTVIRDGKKVMTRELEWARTKGSWRLAKATISTQDGSYRQELSVRNVTPVEKYLSTGSASSDTVTRVRCAQEELSARVSFSGRSRPSVPKAYAAVPNLGVSLIVGDDCGFTADCNDEYQDWLFAQQALAITHLATGGACGALAWSVYAGGLGIIVPPVGLGLASACALAITAEYVAFRYAEWQRGKWYECQRKNRVNQTRVASANIDTSLFSNLSVSSAVRTPGVSLSVNNSCDWTAGGGGGGYFGPGGGPPGGGCHAETWEISYDGGSTWSPIEVTVCGS